MSNDSNGQAASDLDILDMPLEGIAAFWLSLKKILGNKFTTKAVADEAERTKEPFIRYLLEIGPSSHSDETVRRLAGVRRDVAVAEVARRFELMRIALLDVAGGENPRKTLVRMTALFPERAISEAKVSKMSLDMVRMAETGSKETEYAVSVSHRMAADQLLVKLMFYVFWARRGGKADLEPFAGLSDCRLFKESLSLVADGFEKPFIRERMEALTRNICNSARRKMDMSTDMVLALRTKASYDEVYAVARAYMP